MDRIAYADQTIHALYGEMCSSLNDSDPDFMAMKERLIYGEIYQHIKLDARLRELLILVTAAANQTQGEISIHTQAALHVGAAPEEIKEAVYHCAPYIGLGKTEEAVQTVNEVLKVHAEMLPLLSQRTVSEETRLEQGIAAQKAVFGPQIDLMRASTPADQAHIQNYLSAYCFGDVYTRTGLDIQQRELLTFCILCAQGGCENQLRSHIGGNASVGNDRQVLLDALTVCLPYIGFPRTLNALTCINEILPASQPESSSAKASKEAG